MLRSSALALCLSMGTAIVAAAAPAAAQVSIGISVNFAPPRLPVYDQPPIPAPDFIWVPGYWAWSAYDQDYFWIPGTWLRAPRPGLLWTPAWWASRDGVFVFHEGYWSPHVGFYGGIPYGFGYTGFGYQGGYWDHGHVFYNRSVTNITNVRVTNVYEKTVIVNRVTNVSYNGGPGGIAARPSAADQMAEREQHVAPPAMQMQHLQAAQRNRTLFAAANHGHPAIAATVRPAAFTGAGVIAAHSAPHREAGSFSGDARERPKPSAQTSPQAGHRPAEAMERTQAPALSNERRGGAPDPDTGHADARSFRQPGHSRSSSEQEDEVLQADRQASNHSDEPRPPRPRQPPSQRQPHDRQPHPPHPHGGGAPHPHPHPQGGHPKPPHREEHHG